MILSLEDVYASCYRIDDIGLAIGSVLEAGRWGSTVLSVGPNHHQFEREQIYETVRADEFPEKPSRLSSSFAFPTFTDADYFHEGRWNEGIKQHMYHAVPTILDAPIHIGYMFCMPPKDGVETAEIARAYWRGDREAFGVNFHATSPLEIVIASPLRILALLSQVE